MAMAYGTVWQPESKHYRHPVTPSEVKSQKERGTSVSLLRTIITVAEVAASFLPGIGPIGATTIALIGATANTAISASEGTLSGIGLAFDFGSALIPAISGFRHAKKLQKILQSEETGILIEEKFALEFERQAGAVDKIANKEIRKIERKINKQVKYWTKKNKAIRRYNKKLRREREQRWIKKMKAWNKVQKRTIRYKNKACGLYDLVTRQEFEEWVVRYLKPLDEFPTWTRYRSHYKIAPKIEAKQQKILDIIFKQEKDKLEIAYNLHDLRKYYEAARDIKFKHLFDEKRFLKQLNVVAGKDADIYHELKNFYVPLIHKKTGKALTLWNFRKEVLHSNKEITKALGEEWGGYWEAIIRQVRGRGRNLSGKEMDKLVDDIMKHIEHINPGHAETIRDLMIVDLKTALRTFSKDAESKWRKWIKIAGSREFNDKWVQKLQMIDANDVGRAPVEFVYRKLKRKIELAFEKRAFKFAYKAARKTLILSKDLEDAFIKSGGVVIASRYLLGMKVLGGPPGSKLVLIKFRKETTKSKSGRNKNGKKDIVLIMSDSDIKKLQAEGSTYWFAVGKRKGWFVSRGGRKTNTSFATLGNNLSLFLGLVPIPALRNVLSITSNWVENLSAMSNGTYTNDWITKFKRAFIRSSINRSARLLTKVVAGETFQHIARKGMTKGDYILKQQEKFIEKRTKDLFEKGELLATHSYEFEKLFQEATKKARGKGQWFGRELQRLSTGVLSTIEGTDKDGNFMWKTQTNKRTGKTVGDRIFNKILTTSLPKSIRGATIRHGNKVGKTYGKSIIGNRRYMGQLGRIYSAVTVNGTVKPLRRITKLG